MNAEEMDRFTLIRWMALINGVNMIYDAAEGNGVEEEDVTLKQNHLVRFIDESTERVRIL